MSVAYLERSARTHAPRIHRPPCVLFRLISRRHCIPDSVVLPALLASVCASGGAQVYLDFGLYRVVYHTSRFRGWNLERGEALNEARRYISECSGSVAQCLLSRLLFDDYCFGGHQR